MIHLFWRWWRYFFFSFCTSFPSLNLDKFVYCTAKIPRYQTQITRRKKNAKNVIFPFGILDEQILDTNIIKNELVYAKFQWLCWSLQSRWLLQNLSAQNIWHFKNQVLVHQMSFAKQCICSSEPTNSGSKTFFWIASHISLKHSKTSQTVNCVREAFKNVLAEFVR